MSTYDASGAIPVDPEVVILARDEDAVESMDFDPISFGYTEVGSVLMIPEGSMLPEGWLPLDGSLHARADWPDYAEALGIPRTQPSFQLPKTRAAKGHVFVVNAGTPATSQRAIYRGDGDV